MSVVEYFRSSYEITVNEKGARAALDFLVRHDIPFYDVQSNGETVSFRLFAPYFREYAARRNDRRFPGEVRRRLGFRLLCQHCRKRAGLLIGGVCAVLLMMVSSLFVWDIRVTGNNALSESDVLTALEKQGLYPGTFIPALNTEKIAQNIVLTVDGVVFFTVNINGTVAEIEMRERIPDTQIIDRMSPSNLVAAMDGQIEAVEITGGIATVKAGQIVKKGDLLASGAIDSKAIGYRLVRARGNVTARVTRLYQQAVPLQETKKLPTGVTHKTYTVKFFSKPIKLFGNDSIWVDTCDKIEEEKRLCLFDKIRLPISVIICTYAEYETRAVAISEKDAKARAEQALQEMREKELNDAEILSIQTECVREGETLVMSQRIVCIMDITKEIPIEAETNANKTK